MSSLLLPIFFIFLNLSIPQDGKITLIMTPEDERPFVVTPRQIENDQEDVFTAAAAPNTPRRSRFFVPIDYVRKSFADRLARRRLAEGFAAGILVSALAVGVYALHESSDTSTSPTILYPGQCKTLPEGSIATGYDFTYDGAASYKDPNVGTIIEAFRPVSICATGERATYQEVNTTESGTLDAIANNYKTQMQNTGCAGGLGCSYITTVVIK